MERLICLVMGYAFGLIQTGYLFGKIVMHQDIRNFGSGNAGSTNTLRTYGLKAALIVFIGDCGKAILAMALARLLFAGSPDTDLLAMYAAWGVTLGHDYPCYLNFKGGKGIASMAGILTAMSWKITVVCLIIFITTVAATRYVSLGSILVSIAFAVMNVLFCRGGLYQVQPACRTEFYIISIGLCALAIWRHRSNIARLLAGTENKIGQKKK